MDKFLKYLILFLIGIILYYILNKQDRFSIGIEKYRRNVESGLLEEVPEGEEVSADLTILLEEPTANHLNTIWANHPVNHPVIDIIFDELKGWGESQRDEEMDDILEFLPHYVFNASGELDHIQNYMNISEDETPPNTIILTPQALDNIQTNPNWKPGMSRALETLYGDTGHIITLEDLRRLAFKIVYHYVLNESGRNSLPNLFSISFTNMCRTLCITFVTIYYTESLALLG